jgi:hypothetical protein
MKNNRNFVPRFSGAPHFVHNLFKINKINHEKGRPCKCYSGKDKHFKS